MNSKDKLFSICCVGYNHALFLTENLDSIARINYPDIEVIVVDDGSMDDSVELLHSIKDNYDFNIKIIAQENTGNVGKNFNNAWRIAKGELIAFISLDDVFNADVMLQEIDAMNSQDDLAFVASSDTVTINDNGYIQQGLPELPIVNKTNPNASDLLELEYSNFGAFYIQGAIFRKSIIDAIECFDEDMTGDDIVLRTKLFRYLQKHEQWKFRLINDNNVFYRMHDNNIHKNSVRQIKIVTEYLEKYWPDREDPKILIDWVCSTISANSLNEYAPMFTFNTRANKLLLNKRVQNCIAESIYKQRNKPIDYVFKKDKKSRLEREITLFNTLKFRYKKKDKTAYPNNLQNVHYLQYKNKPL